MYSALTGGQDPLENEPHVSAWTPEQMRTLLAGYGLTITANENLIDTARRLGIPARQSRFYGLGRAAIADIRR
jgi:hypothetical protein